MDAADRYIAEHLEPEDLVITTDLPLAAIVVEKGATGLNPRGELYSEENVRERLSMRDFMTGLQGGRSDHRRAGPLWPQGQASASPRPWTACLTPA